MTGAAPSDWRPLSRPSRAERGPGRVDWDAPFPRLALCHLLSASGETLVVISLAGSFFFKVDPSQGREKVILGLLFTMAPFALVGPLIGPAIDRVPGGHRRVIQATMVARVLVAVAMMAAVLSDSVALFPEAFAMLVLAKTYQIARSAVVPTTVAGDLELVEANSKLQLASGLAATVAGGVGAALLQISPALVLGLTTAVFLAGTVAALRLHPSAVGEREEADASRSSETVAVPEGLAVAAFGMGTLRFVVGLLTFLLAFELRGDGSVSLVSRAAHTTLELHKRLSPRTEVLPLVGPPPSWWFGAVIVASVVGGLVGALLAPAARRVLAEERMLVAASALALAASVAALVLDGLAADALLSFGIAFAAALGKQAFDAVVQRDIPEWERGRLFAGFESRFQITWVFGALIPALIAVPVDAGAVLIALATAAAIVGMVTGTRPVIRRPEGQRPRYGLPYLSRSQKSSMSGPSGPSGSSGNG